MFQNMTLKLKIVMGASVPLFMLVFSSYIGISSLGSLEETNDWVEHTHTVIQQAMRIETAAVDMETGMRGYLLAGKDDFLDPYKRGKEEFNKQTDALKRVVDDNPAQVKRLDEIQQNIGAWQADVTEPAIALRREIVNAKTTGDFKTMNDIAELVGEARGKSYFDRFRGQVSTFIETEKVLMAERQEAAKSTASSTTLTMIVGTIVAIAISAIVFLLLLRSILAPLAEMTRATNELQTGDGDLTRRLPDFGNNEIGEAAKGINGFLDKIHSVIVEVKKSIAEVVSASDQVSNTSLELSSTAS